MRSVVFGGGLQKHLRQSNSRGSRSRKGQLFKSVSDQGQNLAGFDRIDVRRSICRGEEHCGQKAAPVYAYAVETSLQLTLTELNENLREIYIEAYSQPDTAEFIYLHTTAELKQIFGANFPDYSESDFYEMEIGTAGLMRNYMARKCDIHFPLERKLSRFLTASMRVYRVPEEEQAKVLAFIGSIDIRELAVTVMHKLFAMLEMKYDFKLSTDGETEERR